MRRASGRDERCVFSESLRVPIVEETAGWPPRPGSRAEQGWRAIVRVLRSPLRVAVTPAHDVVTTLFPADCRLCAGPLERLSSVPVCAACLARVVADRPDGCERCGEAADLERAMLHPEDSRFARATAAGVLCRPCRLAPPQFERAVAFGTYADELRELIHLLKFERVPAAAEPLGVALAQAIAPLRAVAAAELLVVAVPLFPARERQRGYNQSVLLAAAALRRLRRVERGWRLIAAHGVLVRRRRTESQWTLAPRQRRRNLQGAFRVAGEVSGREVLLVDDILTSGATAREAARVLRAAGATRVWVATAARAQRAGTVAEQARELEYTRWDLAASAGAGDPYAASEQPRV